MLLKLLWCSLFLVLIKVTVDSAPLEKTWDSDKFHREDLPDQLQELQAPRHRDLEVVKTKSHSYFNINGDVSEHSEAHQEVREDGNLLGSSDTEKKTKQGAGDPAPDTVVREDISIPNKGINEHHILHNDQEIEKKSPQHHSILYMSPTEIAKYIYETGDEAGVATEIQKLVQQGTLNYDEALDLLQNIKSGLSFLGSMAQPQYPLSESPRSYTPEESLLLAQEKLASNEDYDQIQGFMREREASSAPHSKYPISDVLFNLGKIIFSETIKKGDDEARKAMIKITDLLTNEVAEGQMSVNEEKKTLDILLASMIDTLESQKQLMEDSKPKDNNASKSGNLNQKSLTPGRKVD